MEARAAETRTARPQSAANISATEGETALIGAAQAGSAKAFETIMRRHNRQLYRAARAILQNESDAEEVVQEAYLKAFLNLDGFRGHARLSTWLVKITVNEALARLRRRSGGASGILAESRMIRDCGGVVPGLSAQVEANPEAAAAQLELRRLLEIAIDDLPQAQRTVFMLRAVEEFSIEDTAACLNIPPETVKTRLHRARKQLRSRLQQQVASALADTFPFAGVRCDQTVCAVLNRLNLQPPDG